MELYYVAVIVIIVVVLLLKLSRRGRVASRTITFLIGDVRSGKTSMLYYLSNHNNNILTTNSMESNTSHLEHNGKSFTVVDIPGHSYAKESFLVRLGEAKSLVFVIDATNINSIPAVADFLYDILISRSYQQFKTPTLLALNKQDCTNAFKRVDFELFLSREMEKLKKSRKAVQDQREGVNDSLKYDESQFSLDAYRHIKVCEVSVVQQLIQEVESFIFQ